MPSDAVLAALREAGVPSKSAERARADEHHRQCADGHLDYDLRHAIGIATDLDAIGPVAAVHGGPAAKRAMLRLLVEWAWETTSEKNRTFIGNALYPYGLLSLLAPEAPTASADADRKADE